MPAQAHKLDFRGVADRRPFRTKHIPEGDYRAKIVQVDDHESESGNQGWRWTIALIEGPGKGAKYPYYTMVADGRGEILKDQLWKVRNLLTATGLKVPKKLLKVDPNKAVDRTLGVTMEDNEYEGRMSSVIADTIPEGEIVNPELDDYDADTQVEIEDDLGGAEEEIVDEEDLEELEIEEL